VWYFHFKIVDFFKRLIVGKCKEAFGLLLNANLHFIFGCICRKKVDVLRDLFTMLSVCQIM
jgi:hypothetical protein